MNGVEALMRWNHPEKGLISPQEFIPLAEESGVILQIGEWILREACKQNKKWCEAGYQLRIAVNVSATQFMQANFFQIIQTILAETEMPATLLELEITETTILKNTSEVIKKMAELKALGIFITIDDFGTGYSGFNYLKYFCFDKVKIDKSFIDGIQHSHNDQSIIEALITMTKQFGISILAEGIEHIEQADFIRKHAGDEMQGYLFSPPVDAEQLSEILSKTKENASVVKSVEVGYV